MPEHELPAALTAAIERLYVVFADVPLVHPDPCSTCYPPDEVERISRQMRTTALRDLTIDDVGNFYRDGVLTWGDAEDLRHLTPRLMELFCRYWIGGSLLGRPADRDPGFELTPGISLLRFVDGAWWDWAPDERAALAAFLWELWDATLASGTGVMPYGSWLDIDLLPAILAIVPDVQPYLDHWAGSGPVGMRYLAWAVREMRWLLFPFDSAVDSGANPDNHGALLAWLARPETVTLLEAAVRDPATAEFRWELVLGLEAWERPDEQVFQVGSWKPDDHARARARALGVDLDAEMPVPPPEQPEAPSRA